MATVFLGAWIGSEDSAGDGVTFSDGVEANCFLWTAPGSPFERNSRDPQGLSGWLDPGSGDWLVLI